MDKIRTIAVREFLDTVRTKAFIISVVLMPAVIMAFAFGAQWIGRLTEQESMELRRIALLDQTGTGLFAGEFDKQIQAYSQQNPNRPFELVEVPPTTEVESLVAEVDAGEYYAYLKVTADVIEKKAPCELGRRNQQLHAGNVLQGMINEAVHTVRFQQADPPIDRAYINELQRTRVVEVLLSAVSPLQLMAGKIIGMVLVGILLLAVWVSVGYSVAQARGYGYLIPGEMLVYLVLYFVPGFLLFSAFLAAIGSVCNTLKEAQSMASPITILNIVPMMLWFPLSQNPGSAFAVVLSYVPPITPFVMILRICADPDTPLWQVVTTLALLWASVVVTIWAAAKVFRVGVLMYGKPPSLRELLRWVRYA
jgi:ABC-type Na+ efflux pump permease subunit